MDQKPYDLRDVTYTVNNNILIVDGGLSFNADSLDDALKQVTRELADEKSCVLRLCDSDSHRITFAAWDETGAFLDHEELWGALEMLVFDGRFSSALKRLLWRKYDMANIDGSSPEHDRLQHLMALYTLKDAQKEGTIAHDKVDDVERRYKEKYLN